MPKVLLAEDDQTMVTLLKTLLKMEGYQVSALDADEDIVEATLNENPDVLLMDVHMLHVNGIEVLTTLRATPGGENVRVVMTSGLDFREMCLARGANAFIQKPFMPDELINELKRVTE
jgi:two-component system phosphate regulon response regulator PhoB